MAVKTAKGLVKTALFPVAGCLSAAAVMFAACGGEEPAVRQTPPTVAPTVAVETQQPTAVPAPTLPPPTLAPAPTSTPSQAAVEIGHKVGQMGPDFTLTTVEGEEVALAGFQGRPVVLYFYTTW